MRGALKPFGVEIVGLKKDETKFAIKFDPSKAKLDDMLAALKKAGEGAKKL